MGLVMSLQGLLSEKSRPAALAVSGRLFQCLYDLLWRPGSRFLFVRVEDDFDVAKSAMEFTEHRLQTPCIVCPEQSLSLAEEKRIAANGANRPVRKAISFPWGFPTIRCLQRSLCTCRSPGEYNRGGARNDCS